jgi:hypothetical protein
LLKIIRYGKYKVGYSNNLISENDLNEIQKLVRSSVFEEVLIIPLVINYKNLPDDKINIYYGSTTFMNNVYRELEPKGLFYDVETFSMSNYFDK